MWEVHAVGLGMKLRLKKKVLNLKSDTLLTFIMQKLTRPEKPISKTDVLYFFKSKSDVFFFKFEIWHVIKFSIQYYSILKNARRMQKMSFSQSKVYQNVIFCMQTIVQDLRCQKIFNTESTALYFFQSKIWRVVKLLNQTVTRCIFNFNIWHVVKLFIQNLLFKSLFQILAETFSKCSTSKNKLLDTDDGLW